MKEAFFLSFSFDLLSFSAVLVSVELVVRPVTVAELAPSIDPVSLSLAYNTLPGIETVFDLRAAIDFHDSFLGRSELVPVRRLKKVQ